MQEGAAGRLHTLAGPQEVVVAKHQLGRQQAIGQQLLRAIEVGQHAVQQSGTLRHAGGDLLPFFGRNQIGQQVQLPRTVGAIGVGVDVVGHPIFLNLPGQQGLTLRQLRRAAALQTLQQQAPVRTHLTVCIEQFVVSPWRQGVIGKQVGHGRLDKTIKGGAPLAPLWERGLNEAQIQSHGQFIIVDGCQGRAFAWAVAQPKEAC